MLQSVARLQRVDPGFDADRVRRSTLLRSMVFEIETTDPRTYVALGLAMATVVLAASCVPARGQR